MGLMLPVLLPSSELCSESKITATWLVPRSLPLATPRYGGAIGVVEIGVGFGFGRGANKEVGGDLFRAEVPVDEIFLATAGVVTAVAVDAVVDGADAVDVDAIFTAVDDADAVATIDAIFAADGATIGAVDVDAGTSVARNVASVGRSVPRLSTR